MKCNKKSCEYYSEIFDYNWQNAKYVDNDLLKENRR